MSTLSRIQRILLFFAGAVVLIVILIVVLYGRQLSTALTIDNQINSLENDINSQYFLTIYLKPDAPPSDAADLQSQIQTLPTVSRVVIVGKEQALINFKKRHENDPQTLNALETLGTNPLGDEIDVSAKSIADYPAITAYITALKSSTNSGPNAIDNFIYDANGLAKLSQSLDTLNNLQAANRIWRNSSPVGALLYWILSRVFVRPI